VLRDFAGLKPGASTALVIDKYNAKREPQLEW
jgi:hypothetical protein